MISQFGCIVKGDLQIFLISLLTYQSSWCIISKEVMCLKYEIGTRIRKYREKAGISQKELAGLIGVSNSRISNWEQGINRPDADILAELCRALNVSPSELLDVRLAPEDLNEQERRVIMAYRAKTELQNAVNILLGVEE